MSESIEKQLASVFSQAWNGKAESLLGKSSELQLFALREVTGDGMEGALAVAMTWSAAFVVPCTGALGGVLVCLLKSEDEIEIDRLAKQPTDGAPKPGGRALINSVAEETATQLTALSSMPISFDPAMFVDLTVGESRLAKIVGDTVWIGTYALTVGDDLQTQALMLYAPNGSLEVATPSPAEATSTANAATATTNTAAATTADTSMNQSQSSAQQPTRRPTSRREEPPPRNIERLLDVELEVIVRFGTTNMPLRDVVRMGVGAMIELNRAVDEPVELLINNRPLARGEVVVVDGYYGVRITEIGTPSERALSIINS